MPAAEDGELGVSAAEVPRLRVRPLRLEQVDVLELVALHHVRLEHLVWVRVGARARARVSVRVGVSGRPRTDSVYSRTTTGRDALSRAQSHSVGSSGILVAIVRSACASPGSALPSALSSSRLAAISDCSSTDGSTNSCKPAALCVNAEATLCCSLSATPCCSRRARKSLRSESASIVVRLLRFLAVRTTGCSSRGPARLGCPRFPPLGSLS
eukprot:scaffold35495_cov59-Phaeocystis_antarctica.AAC.2